MNIEEQFNLAAQAATERYNKEQYKATQSLFERKLGTRLIFND